MVRSREWVPTEDPASGTRLVFMTPASRAVDNLRPMTGGEFAVGAKAAAGAAEAGKKVLGEDPSVKAQLAEYAAAGVSGVYLQHLVHRDIAMVELIGRELVG